MTRQNKGLGMVGLSKEHGVLGALSAPIAVLVGIFIFTLSFLSFSSTASAQSAAGSSSSESLPYDKIDLRAGVFNDGQAALWDLNELDHFHIFGPPERARGYRPEQPIAFSHVTHVQKNKMECQYCHWTVTKSPYAAVPEVQACMGCHGLIVGGTTPDQQKEIAKLREYAAANRPIPWVKVHVMPNHVHFNHKRHIKAGVSCQECHGQIPKMERVERVSSMKMGWCIECHRERGASIDCYTCHY